MRYQRIDSKLFIENRKKLIQKLKPNSIAIVNSNDEFPRNGDQSFPFRQNSGLFYISGLDQKKTIVVLYPDCPVSDWKEIVFTIEIDEKMAIWEGSKYSKKEATEVSGIKTVLWLEEFERVLHELMVNADNVYLNANENPKFITEVPYRDIRFTKWIKGKYSNHTYNRLAPLLTELRLKKHPIEIELINKACSITEKAFRRVLKFVRPGIMEYEIQAEIEHEFTNNGANGSAYYPIVASGKNALCLHYCENNSECKDGDLILFDFGAEYANYASDLSRTIPVNGRYNKRQKECYNAVLRVMKQSKTMLVPGTTLDDYNKEVNKIMESEMIGLGLFTKNDMKKQDPDKPLFFKYYMHGTSHFMGLDVHDVGTKQTKFEPGMVFSCEPGIYIPEENLGVRIENDILITENGQVDLMENIPIEIEEIEALMADN